MQSLPLPIVIIVLYLASFTKGTFFEAVAYGNRRFSFSPSNLLTSDNEIFTTYTSEAKAVLRTLPKMGIVKQENCIDSLSINETVNFDDEQLTFCYEGGPQMLESVADNFTFDILGDNNETFSQIVELIGSDPVVFIPPRDTIIHLYENTPKTFTIDSFIAKFQDNVTELDSYQVEIIAYAPDHQMVVVDSLGNEIDVFQTFDMNESFTIVPLRNRATCGTIPFKYKMCDELKSFFITDSVGFTLVYGHDEHKQEDNHLDIYFTFESKLESEFHVMEEEVNVTFEDVDVAFFSFNSSYLHFLPNKENPDRYITVVLNILTPSALSIRALELPFIQFLEVTTCFVENAYYCTIIMTSTIEVLNHYINRSILLLAFDMQNFEKAALQIYVNGVHQYREISFKRVGSSPTTSPIGDRKVPKYAVALIAIVLIVACLVCWLSRRRQVPSISKDVPHNQEGLDDNMLDPDKEIELE